MKKVIAALLFFAALFCFVSCTPEAGGGKGGNSGNGGDGSGAGVDATTLDGYYVYTIMAGGKPVNTETWIIKDSTLKVYETEGGNGANYKAQLDGLSQKLSYNYQIEKQGFQGLSFRIIYSDELSLGPYTLTTTSEGVFLVEDGERCFEKVLPETTGTPVGTADYFYMGSSLFIYGIKDGVDELRFYDFQLESFSKNGQVITVTGIRYWDDGIDENVDVNDATFTITLGDTSAVVSEPVNWPTGEYAPASPAGTWTKYIRETPWPVAPAN